MNCSDFSTVTKIVIGLVIMPSWERLQDFWFIQSGAEQLERSLWEEVLLGDT